MTDRIYKRVASVLTEAERATFDLDTGLSDPDRKEVCEFIWQLNRKITTTRWLSTDFGK